jgi:CCR4-NOT transcriptional regulation complex NOT5 subunit
MPSQSNAGVDLCDCYAASSTAPFDECEGEGDETCAIAKCMNSCDGMAAFCFSPESNEGTCALYQATNPSTPVSDNSPTTSPPSTNVSASTKEVEVDSTQSGAVMTRSQRFMMSMSVIVVIVFVLMFM